ncbi:hypothetical protein MRX96_032063 [Rhipicephalus microplus]
MKVPIPIPVNFAKHPGKASFYPGMTGIPVTLQDGTLKQGDNYNCYQGASATTGFGDQQSQGDILGGKLEAEPRTAQ